MAHQRVSVIFWNETITLDGIEKRIPLRLPHLLRLKRLDWYAGTHSGLILFNDQRELQFSEPAVVMPFIERWQLEPAQPDIAQLKRYVDEITIDPGDTYDSTPRRRWTEIEKRHPQPIYAAALLQLLSTQYALDADRSVGKNSRTHPSKFSEKIPQHRSAVTNRSDSIVRSLLNRGSNMGSNKGLSADSDFHKRNHQTTLAKMVKLADGNAALKKREAERRRMQNNAKSR